MIPPVIRYYILDGHTPVPCDSVIEWSQWFETADRHVALTEIGTIRVSTVFLGLDHAFSGEKRPILFETMAFADGDGDGDETIWFDRCSTWDEAEQMHRDAVQHATEMVLKVAEIVGATLRLGPKPSP